MSQSNKVRLFVALDVPRPHLDSIQSAIAPLKDRFAGARWTPVDNQHVTLKFLGWSSSDALQGVGSALRTLAAAHEPASIRLTGVGTFPSARRMRVLWVGIEDPVGLLAGLAGGLDRVLSRLGFEPETRPFTAHLTLARFKLPERLADPVVAPLPELAPFDVREMVLYRSHLSPKGPRYERLQVFPLGSGGRSAPIEGEQTN